MVYMAEEDQRAGHRHRRIMRRRTSGSHKDTVLITSARRSPMANWRHRRHLYAGLQLARIPLFIAAVAVYGWLHNPAIAAVIAVISLPLPWIAVLLANESGEGAEKGVPKVYKPALIREQRAQALEALHAQASRTPLPTAETPHGPSSVVIDENATFDEMDPNNE